jgi:uncharacterized membrane protein
MPSRAAHLIAFLSITLISVSCHVYIFRQFARMIRRDFPRRQRVILQIAKAAFIYFDLPFVYIFFWRHISGDVSNLTQFLLYPFAVWQMVLLVWAVILVPIGLFRSKAVSAFSRTSNRLVVKPIATALRRSLRPGREVILETSEEVG